MGILKSLINYVFLLADKDIFHSDFKPENFCLDFIYEYFLDFKYKHSEEKKYKPKIIDMGLANFHY